MKKLTLALFTLWIQACSGPSNSIEGSIQRFKSEYPDHFVTYTHDSQTMRYAWSGDPEKRPLLFVHGSPGSYEGWSEFLLNAELQKNFHLIAVDRPGYGGSGAGATETSLQKQAAALVGSLAANRSGLNPIVIGHSMGGPVIARFAMDFPEKTAGLIFVAASVDPGLEDPPWYQYAADWKAVRWALPGWLRVCNQELLPLKGELEAMRPLWKNIKAPVVIVHGDRDNMVPYENVNFLKANLQEGLILNVDTLPGMNHFIPWKQADSIIGAIQKLNGFLTTSKNP